MHHESSAETESKEQIILACYIAIYVARRTEAFKMVHFKTV